MPTNILLVDDHRIVRDGVRSILANEPEFHVVAEAESGVEAVQICRRLRPDMVLMDIRMPGMTGIEATRDIMRFFPETKVVMLTMSDEDDLVLASFRAGARAYLVKNASAGDLIDALRTVAKGGSYISAQVSTGFLARIQQGNLEPATPENPLDLLSRREIQVMRFISEGRTSKEIAETLDIGVQTVRGYRKSLMRKLGVNRVAGITQIAIASGLAQPPQCGVEYEQSLG